MLLFWIYTILNFVKLNNFDPFRILGKIPGVNYLSYYILEYEFNAVDK